MPAYYARAAFEAVNNVSGTLIVNVLHVECDVLTSPPDWTSIASDIHSWLGVPYNGILTTDETLTQIVVTDENYPGSTHGQGVSPFGTTGGRSPGDGKLSPAICRLASYKTAVAKRYGRGHTFLPPAYDSAALAPGGGWATGNPYALACQPFLSAYLAGHTAGSTSYVPIIFSRTLVNRGDPTFKFVINGGSLSPKQHWLRSRTTSP